MKNSHDVLLPLTPPKVYIVQTSLGLQYTCVEKTIIHYLPSQLFLFLLLSCLPAPLCDMNNSLDKDITLVVHTQLISYHVV